MLTVEEKERLQKEEKLNKAGKKISLAAEELNTYRWEQIWRYVQGHFTFVALEMWCKRNQNKMFTVGVFHCI